MLKIKKSLYPPNGTEKYWINDSINGQIIGYFVKEDGNEWEFFTGNIGKILKLKTMEEIIENFRLLQSGNYICQNTDFAQTAEEQLSDLQKELKM